MLLIINVLARAFILIVVLTISTEAAHEPPYIVRISSLNDVLVPPNPVTIYGRVTSTSPLKVSDGSGEIVITGLTAHLDDFLVVTGDWNNNTLTPKAGSVARNYITPSRVEMVFVPAGSFLMGNNNNEGYSYYNELPQHSVSLNAYWIGMYEVTRKEYAAFLIATNRPEPSFWAAQQNWGTGSFIQTDSHPVVGVSWQDADAYATWAGGKLPTEPEWEKAARWTGSSPNVYPWGDIWNKENCNGWGDTNIAGGGPQFPKSQTAAVGSYKGFPSHYGCQDMAGNVWEWCSDWFVSYPGAVPFEDYTNVYKVLRGGSWFNIDDTGYYYRASCRSGVEPGGKWSDVGFRLARD